MDTSMTLATDLCAMTPGSALIDRHRAPRAWSGTTPVVRQGATFSWLPVAPQHQQPLQRPSASRPRIR
jgi:hypothetical protein